MSTSQARARILRGSSLLRLQDCPRATTAGGSKDPSTQVPKYLANCGAVSLTGALTIQQEMGLLRAGEVDPTHNNVVNISDFNTMKAVLGTTSPAGGLNNDWVTNVSHFNLLKINLGHS